MYSNRNDDASNKKKEINHVEDKIKTLENRNLTVKTSRCAEKKIKM